MNIYRPERLTAPPDAVLFDLDNTFYAYDPAHAAGMTAVRGKLKQAFGVEPASFDAAFDAARLETKARLKGTAASHNRLLYFQRTLERLELGAQVLLALELEQTYWRSFLGAAVLFPEGKELLDDLRILGIPCALITDLGAQIQFKKISFFELDPFFSVVVTSEEAGADKPHSAPYELALQKLGVSGTLWMVGDNPTTDIAGARRVLGAVTLQKIHAGVIQGTGDEAPDVAFEHFGELRQLLTARVGAKGESPSKP